MKGNYYRLSPISVVTAIRFVNPLLGSEAWSSVIWTYILSHRKPQKNYMHALVSAISLSCHNVRRFKKPYFQFHFNRLQILFQDAHPLTPGWRSCRSDAILAWPWNSSHKFMVDKLPGIQPRAKDSKPSLVLVWFRVSFLKVPSVLENQHVTVTHLYKLIESIYRAACWHWLQFESDSLYSNYSNYRSDIHKGTHKALDVFTLSWQPLRDMLSPSKLMPGLAIAGASALRFTSPWNFNVFSIAVINLRNVYPLL